MGRLNLLFLERLKMINFINFIKINFYLLIFIDFKNFI